MKLVLLPRWHLPWPMPALLAWASAWGLFLALRGASGALALCAAVAVSAGLAWAWPSSAWRRGLIAGGFPLSVLLSLTMSGATWSVPPMAWLAPLALLLLIYPLQAWRDAPMFPTPVGALQGLAEAVTLPAGARVLDAGSGLGHGLQALHRALPTAQVQGVEHSWLLVGLSRLRCPWAHVRQGDMWRRSWQGFDLVYLFQRPESMARALAKAEAEMAPGSWLVSLEFEVPGRAAEGALRCVAGKPVWLHRIATADVAAQAQSMPGTADKDLERAPRRACATHRG